MNRHRISAARIRRNAAGLRLSLMLAAIGGGLYLILLFLTTP